MKYNTEHQKKAYQSEIYQDKIYNKLQEDRSHDKILNRILEKNECDSNAVFKFLQLLKVPN